MRRLTEDDGPETVLNAVDVLAMALEGNPDVEDMLPPVAAVQSDLEGKMRAHRLAANRSVSRTRRILFADGVEDDAIHAASREVLAANGNDRKSPLFVSLFAQAVSKTVDGVATDAQVAQSLLLIQRLGDPSEDIPPRVREVRPALVAARAGVEQAQALRTQAGKDELLAWNALQVSEAAARAVYNEMHPKLQLIYPGQPHLVESFFHAPKVRRKKVEPVEADDDDAESAG
jgi:hypothetical protein